MKAKSKHTKKPVKSFQATLKEATQAMPPHQRFFSKIIHTRLVSLLSDIISATILRPNALLFGAIAAFGFTLTTYFVAKNLGYRLSGFEFIGGFTFGWILGLAYDLINFITNRKK